jgi:hypothetical protein
MVTIILHCPHCGSEALVRDGHAPNGKQKYRFMAVGVAAARARLPMPIHKLVARRFCTPIKNEAACVASPARLGSLGPPSPVGSKKSRSASSLTDHPARSRPRGSHFHCTGTGRTVVVCAQKSVRLLDLDRLVPQDASSGRLCTRRSERKDVSTLVGGHSSSLPPRTLLHGLLGGIQGGDPRGATYGCRKRERRNRPRRALE